MNKFIFLKSLQPTSKAGGLGGLRIPFSPCSKTHPTRGIPYFETPQNHTVVGRIYKIYVLFISRYTYFKLHVYIMCRYIYIYMYHIKPLLLMGHISIFPKPSSPASSPKGCLPLCIITGRRPSCRACSTWN